MFMRQLYTSVDYTNLIKKFSEVWWIIALKFEYLLYVNLYAKYSQENL